MDTKPHTNTATDAVLDLELLANATSLPIIGDWHGNTGWAMKVIRNLHRSHPESRVLLHLGDFGVYRDNKGRKFLHKVNKLLRDFNQYLLVTLGNHEDRDLLKKTVTHPGNPELFYFPDYPHVLFFTQAATWVTSGVKFMSVGGANSINRYELTDGRSWWEGEQISDEDVHAAICKGSVDVLLSHEAPYSPAFHTAAREAAAREEWGDDGYEYAVVSSLQLAHIAHAVEPTVLFHGHYHVRETVETYGISRDGEKRRRKTESLGMDGDVTGNVVIYHPVTGEVEPYSVINL